MSAPPTAGDQSAAFALLIGTAPGIVTSVAVRLLQTPAWVR